MACSRLYRSSGDSPSRRTRSTSGPDHPHLSVYAVSVTLFRHSRLTVLHDLSSKSTQTLLGRSCLTIVSRFLVFFREGVRNRTRRRLRWGRGGPLSGSIVRWIRPVALPAILLLVMTNILRVFFCTADRRKQFVRTYRTAAVPKDE